MLGQLYRVLVIAVFAMTSLASIEALAKKVGTLTVVKGKVWIINKKGKKKKARIGKKIEDSDTLKTEKDSRAKLTMLDKNVINISPETEMKLEKYVFDPKNDKKDVLLNVIYGKVRSNVQQKYDGKKNRFQVKTKAAVAGVRGTDFLISFNPSTRKATFVTFSGAVVVGTVTKSGVLTNAVRINPGETSSASVGAKPLAPKKLSTKALAQINRATGGVEFDSDGGDSRVPSNDSSVDNEDKENGGDGDDTQTGKEKEQGSEQGEKQNNGDPAADKESRADGDKKGKDGKDQQQGPGNDRGNPQYSENGSPDGAGPGNEGRGPDSVGGPGPEGGPGLDPNGMVGAGDLPGGPGDGGFIPDGGGYGGGPALGPLPTDPCAINPASCGGFRPDEICPTCDDFGRDAVQNGKTRLIIDVINN